MSSRFSIPNIEHFLCEVKFSVDKDALSNKIAQWTANPRPDGEFTDEEIIYMLAEPESFDVPKLLQPPHSPQSLFCA